MTAVDYKKALEPCSACGGRANESFMNATGYMRGKVFCAKHSCHMNKFLMTPEEWNTRTQPCAEATTEDELAKAVTEFIEEMDYDPSNYALEVPALKRALAKSGHLKVKA